MSDYVRSIINADDGSGTVQLVQMNVDEKRIADLLHELKKSGTNLNQIAYKLNARGDIDLGEFGEAVRRHRQAASDVSDFMEELRPAPRPGCPSRSATDRRRARRRKPASAQEAQHQDKEGGEVIVKCQTFKTTTFYKSATQRSGYLEREGRAIGGATTQNIADNDRWYAEMDKTTERYHLRGCVIGREFILVTVPR